MNVVNLNRREALALGLSAAGGLLLGGTANSAAGTMPAAARSTAAARLNAWVSITPDGRITLITPGAELGQGIYTALPLIVAEDMEADFADVTVAFCGYDPTYNNPMKGFQSTGRSAAVRGYYSLLRRMGASARDMLLAAAAQRWQVPVGQCVARGSVVRHADSQLTATYGELAREAAQQTPPVDPPLKSAGEFRLVGKRIARKDTPVKVDGSVQFASDLVLPGMLHAAVRVSPVPGGRVARLDAARARAAAGVVDVVAIDHGVAVVAASWWQAHRALDLLEIEFDSGAGAAANDRTIDAAFATAFAGGGLVVDEKGDADAMLAASAQPLTVEYAVPYLAHATMEPMSCVASVTADRCIVLAPTQGPTVAHKAAVAASGLAPDKVEVSRMFIGGGFGRRYNTDFVTQAVQISRAVGRPIKLLWSREEDTTHDFYRPTARIRYRAALAADGSLRAVDILGASPSLRPLVGKADAMTMEGVIDQELPLEHLRVRHAPMDSPLPIGMWRSVSHSHNGFFKESFMDELAYAAGRDPYEFRRALLAGTRLAAVLDLAAQRSGWGTPLATGRARGIAIVQAYGSIVAQVAEVSLESGEPRVHRVVCAVDCGLAIDPGNIAAQMESGVVFGLTAALWGEINVEGGAVAQRNFNDYRVLRFNEMPRVETWIVPSTESPGGIGETAVPPIAPAVANALFALTGKRIRRLPIAGNFQ